MKQNMSVTEKILVPCISITGRIPCARVRAYKKESHHHEDV